MHFSIFADFVHIGFDSARIASASTERSFSAKRRIKSHLRASMSEMRTSDLSSISVERELSDSGPIMKNPSAVVDVFASMGKQRLTLL